MLNNTRGSMAQLSIPGQGSYLELCTILSSEMNNNESFSHYYEGFPTYSLRFANCFSINLFKLTFIVVFSN